MGDAAEDMISGVSSGRDLWDTEFHLNQRKESEDMSSVSEAIEKITEGLTELAEALGGEGGGDAWTEEDLAELDREALMEAAEAAGVEVKKGQKAKTIIAAILASQEDEDEDEEDDDSDDEDDDSDDDDDDDEDDDDEDDEDSDDDDEDDDDDDDEEDEDDEPKKSKSKKSKSVKDKKAAAKKGKKKGRK